MLACLFDETGNDAVAQSYSATSLRRRKFRALSGSLVASVRYGFGKVFWFRLVRRSDGSASVLPSLSMCFGRCWLLFDVDVVRVWGTCRGSSPEGAEPHQLQGLMSGGRPPVGSRCGISCVLAEPCEGRTMWAEVKGCAVPYYLGRTKAKVRQAGLAEPRGSAVHRVGLAFVWESLMACPMLSLVHMVMGRNKGWFGWK